MTSQQPPTTKKRKSNESDATEQAAFEPTNLSHHPNLPSPPQYFASPQRYATQYAHHGGYSYPTAQQYPYQPSPSHGYTNLPPPGYRPVAPMHPSSIHGTAHHPPPPSNSFVTPETQQTTTSSAFASPPSSLRRHPLGSVNKGVIPSSSGKASNRPCKFIHFLSMLTMFVRSDCLNSLYLGILLLNTKFGHHFFLCDVNLITCWALTRTRTSRQKIGVTDANDACAWVDPLMLNNALTSPESSIQAITVHCPIVSLLILNVIEIPPAHDCSAIFPL